MGFRKKTVKDVEVKGKVVLVRVDYNVPMKDGAIVEDMRIKASLPTINYLLEQGAEKVVLISHMGRPKGEKNLEFSLAPIAARLGELLPGKNVIFSSETTGPVAKETVSSAASGSVILLENLRFSPAEEENSAEFAQEILDASGAELFVQDGFAVIHRAHASTDAIARVVPAVAGFLVEKEVTELEGAIKNPEHPLVVVIGGAKVEDKAPMIEKFLPIADKIIVGGKIAADGYKATDPKIYVAEDFAEDENGNKMDIGGESCMKILQDVHTAKTVVWNGTMGYVEDERFAKGSNVVAVAMGTNKTGTTIVGGGDTAGFVEGLIKENPELKYTLISTGGGASLELLSGKELPGLEVLRNA